MRRAGEMVGVGGGTGVYMVFRCALAMMVLRVCQDLALAREPR